MCQLLHRGSVKGDGELSAGYATLRSWVTWTMAVLVKGQRRKTHWTRQEEEKTGEKEAKTATNYRKLHGMEAGKVGGVRRECRGSLAEGGASSLKEKGLDKAGKGHLSSAVIKKKPEITG